MKLKKIISVMLASLLLLTIFPMNAAAAKKGISLDKTSLSLAVGETYKLTRTVTGYQKYTVQWSSSDKTVAAVSKGTVTAKKEGTATITAKIKGTDYKATCKVTVKKKSSGKASGTSAKGTYATGQDLLDEMTVGWNLGNTLDATGNGLSSETAWGNPKVTKGLIDAVKKAGFNTIRIPVTWGGHVDSEGKIDKAWLDRVQEVVDYAKDNDMFIILNMHHDNGLIPLDEASEKATAKKYKNIWKQIATRFKDYDEKLLFEGRNEPRTEGSANEWNGGTKKERDVLNRMYETFVETVRATGGNNKTRFLIIAPYAASSGYTAMAALKIPDDDRIIVAVHAYSPYNVALNRYSNEKSLTENGKKEIDNVFSDINKVFLSKGIPVILDECGALNKSNEKERAEVMKYQITAAKSYGVPCVVWDNGSTCDPSQGEGFGLLNRNTCEWYYPDLVKAITNAAK